MHHTLSPPLAATFAQLPAESWVYLSLYLATLVLHAIFMGYVLAGSAYLAVVVTVRKPGERGPVEPLLREWLPLMLSLAITAGIAPLLFIQILYRPAFYTANLLLFHRWMAVVPVLIVGFYLLYLLKNRWGDTRSRSLSIVMALTTAACFAFIAWSWTENHLLSLAGQQTWSRQYVSGSVVYHPAELLPRLAMWFCGTFPILAVWLSWQLWWPQRHGETHHVPGTPRVAAMGLAGLVTSVVCGCFYLSVMPAIHRSALSDPQLAVPYGLLFAGTAGTLVLLLIQFRDQRLTARRLSLLSASVIVMLSGLALLREAIRLASIDLTELLPIHETAADVGGRWVFLAFLVINGLLISWCLRMALSTHRKPS